MGVALITLHGMGTTQPDYANDLIHALKDQMTPQAFAGLSIQSVYYQKILQDNEQRVWNNTDAQTKVHYDDLRKFLLFGFGDAGGLENRKEDDNSAYEQAQVEIAKALLAAFEAKGADTDVVFISHSLGCQVLSNYLWDAQTWAAVQATGTGSLPDAGIWKTNDTTLPGLSAAQKKFLTGATCMAWVTTGCNIPIFVAAHAVIEPIKRPRPEFVWKNFYDPDDVLGWPLRPLSAAYAALVEDVSMNAGRGFLNWALKSWNPLSHTAYWDDDDVVKPLAHLLS